MEKNINKNDIDYGFKLLNQYCHATGVRNININSEEFIKNFKNWVESRRIMGFNYVQYLASLGILNYPINDESLNEGLVEIGKGLYDSMALVHGMDVITPYFIESGISNNSVFDLDSDMVKRDNGIIYTTFNPYTSMDLDSWEKIVNLYNKSLVVGMFGKLNDLDYQDKLKALTYLSDGISSPRICKEISRGDEYYAVLASGDEVLDRMQKKLVKKNTLY